MENRRQNKFSKDRVIAEIQGLMEEQGKTKEWLLEELNKNRITLRTSPTANSFEILNYTPNNILKNFYKFLKSDDFSIDDVKTPTKTMHWFFTDIIGSSNLKIPTKAQIRKINVLNTQIQNTETFKKRDPNSTVILPTGDGMAIGFSDSPEQPFRLAIQVHKLLKKYNKTQKIRDQIHIRIGLDSGPVYFIKDVQGQDSVWGPGIIMARRVMDLCENDQIFASARIGDDISKLSLEYKEIMHPIGEYLIKHGEQLQVYNIFDKSFGNKFAPKKFKIVPITQNFNPANLFKFNKIEIILDILDTKKMMTRHTWIWNVRNISKEPLGHLFYEINGDSPKKIEELNLKIKDRKGKKLEISSLDVNKPLEKKFHIKLNRPIKKNQSETITLVYDWEEPDRVFDYVFSAKCEKFKYIFTIPRSFEIKTRILENLGLGRKLRVNDPPKIRYTNEKTKIVWESPKNRIMNPHDSYEFQW
ncbi:MAG: hypothetical protein KGZ37_04565 [Nitrosarchaeum sp.]|nr:hypothetical protein [Nitrosarchaeum sp.]